MTGHVDQRLGFSAQFEQARHGWQIARQNGSALDGVTWLGELRAILERTNGSEALKTIENSYHKDLSGLTASIAEFIETTQGADTATPDFWERGDKYFEHAFFIIDGAGL
jgi:hypothetical protein